MMPSVVSLVTKVVGSLVNSSTTSLLTVVHKVVQNCRFIDEGYLPSLKDLGGWTGIGKCCQQNFGSTIRFRYLQGSYGC